MSELEELKMKAAKVIGYSVQSTNLYGAEFMLCNSMDYPVTGKIYFKAEQAWQDLPAWGESADANRELLEWLAKQESEITDKFECEIFEAGTKLLLGVKKCLNSAIEVLLVSPLDVLRAFVAATETKEKE